MMNHDANANTRQHLEQLYRHMVTAREIDVIEQDYTGRGEAFFHVSGWGHEATATLAPHLTAADWLHCHYRDKALMLARGISPRMFFLSLFNKDESHSRGRQMNAHMSAPEHNVLSLVGPVGNSALQAVGVASVVKEREGAPIVLCSLGDGMTQQGEVLESIAHAVRDRLPVLFLVQDNSFAISTRTPGRTFYSTPDGDADSFYGIPISRIDGRLPVAALERFGEIAARMRSDRNPSITVFNVDRLDSHTNADDHRVYRTADEIASVRAEGDPIVAIHAALIAAGADEGALASMREHIRRDLRAIAHEAQRSAEPQPIHTAVHPLDTRLTEREAEYTGGNPGTEGELTMIEALREVLRARMAADERVRLFGEDLEDPKGDVFGVTRGLSQQFPGRVVNSPLAESTIVGVSVGQALAGARPVGFLQFADFLPIAYNQIFAEMGSIYWRTDGGWRAPLILLVSCGGYRPGLGPFHASSMEGIAAHTPGVDVFMPSTAGDAAGLLNAAFESERPTILFYPKNCLNDRSAVTTTDVARQLVPIGTARRVREGSDVTLVGWGNTVGLCRRAADALASADVEADVIDLRSIVPWDVSMVAESVEKTGRLVVVHEDTHTAGMGAEVVSTISERAKRPIIARRVTRGDTYVPCNFANQLEVLPSYRRVLETTVALLGGSVHWHTQDDAEQGILTVEAMGASPSDESVTVAAWFIKPGDQIAEGAPIAELEADKASFELKNPIEGTVDRLLCPEGHTVKVGEPLFSVRPLSAEAGIKPVTREDPGEPIITGIDTRRLISRPAGDSWPLVGRAASGDAPTAGLVGVATKMGSRTVDNDELSRLCPSWSPADIVQRTGIETRRWLSDSEDALSIAVGAAKEVLGNHSMAIDDIDLVVCSTGTPLYSTPSMAALLQYELSGGRDTNTTAYDISAACSGYLFGLQIVYDFLAGNPDGRALLVTTEALSKKLDTADPDTAPIFADGATATILVGAAAADLAHASVYRPVTGTMGESGAALKVPHEPDACISMNGQTVYQIAVRSMIDMLKRACDAARVGIERLKLIVPHQANQRIVDAIRKRLKLPKEMVHSSIRNTGNTSSSTIPICLADLLPKRKPDELIGLTAFGGGFTYAGGVLRTIR